MNVTDQVKVLNKGFIIIREREQGLHQEHILIVSKTKSHPEWHHFATAFKTKTARRKCMDMHLKSNLIIED